ncbi:MAG: PKD domain-containing protein [Bacteroidetes bacterium]|nr:PKD domain-containing protein [Bacteroidota bacterium]
MKYIITIIAFLLSINTFAQPQTKRVLFLGNSYTDVNNLPQMVADVTTSMGDVLIFDSNNPGGYTLQGHSTNATSLSKIMLGNWDYVVLQEQSQLPSFPIGQVITDVFPYAYILDSIINVYNPCGETVFYMTWGRKNGDASNCATWPPVCTYDGMDSLLNLRYRMMADSNHAILSPVGAVWHYFRQNFPLLDLYQSDESHPSIAGSYLAACTFYTCLFRKDPSLIPFTSSLSISDAINIKNAVKLIVFDSLMNWHIGEYDHPVANYNYTLTAVNQLTFTNTSSNAISYNWDFGDGSNSILMNPVHQYTNTGSYIVRLIASNCNEKDTIFHTINVYTTSVAPTFNYLNWTLSPNPASSSLVISFNSIENMNYNIYNYTGIKIQSGTINNTSKKIDVSSLSKGIYFIQLIGKDVPYRQLKFIKE